MTTIGEYLDMMTIEGDLFESMDNQAVRCLACGHRCLIREGKRGICQVRFNRHGKLYVPWGYVAALQADPIEKKPLYHFLPGSIALTYGMLGCDFHCDYCQNHLTSQAMRDPASDIAVSLVRKITPEQIITIAQRNDAEVIASSYNEPLITSEWSVSIFKLAIQAGMKCVYISNGNLTLEALKYLSPYLSGYKIDLKSMQDRHYRQLGGVLNNVLEGIQKAHQLGLWVEVVTLVVPGFNDSNDELMDTARFIASVSRDIPWHVTAFHPDYKMIDRASTPVDTIIRAAEIGQEAGLQYVYAGNISGRAGQYEDTICPHCQKTLVERRGFSIRHYKISAQGSCPFCEETLPGVWTHHPEKVQLGGLGMPRWIV